MSYAPDDRCGACGHLHATHSRGGRCMAHDCPCWRPDIHGPRPDGATVTPGPLEPVLARLTDLQMRLVAAESDIDTLRTRVQRAELDLDALRERVRAAEERS